MSLPNAKPSPLSAIDHGVRLIAKALRETREEFEDCRAFNATNEIQHTIQGNKESMHLFRGRKEGFEDAIKILEGKLASIPCQGDDDDSVVNE